MRTLFTLCVLVALTGCRGVELSPREGTELETTSDGDLELKTYVTQEEYERMTPAERERVNASVGVDATVARWGSHTKEPEAVPTGDLDKAMKNAEPRR